MEIVKVDESKLQGEFNSSISPPLTASFNPQGVYDQLNQYFSEQDLDGKSILEAREILGESAKDLTDEQVLNLIHEIQFLVESWLEEYEKDVFDGKTLNEILNI